MNYSILHISDIHKSKSVSYDSLLQSLARDMEAYTDGENIQRPSFIVVSGDIIQGAYEDDVIREQYAEASDFLNKLVDMVLQGDKAKMIIVPGNHDMNRKTSKDSITTSISSKKDDLDALKKGSNVIRWCWDDFEFKIIANEETYSHRFDLFLEFYNSFYAGIRSWQGSP